MRMLLTPYVQHEIGVVLLRPGRELLHHFFGRIVIARETDEFKSVPSGMLPIVKQNLAADPRLSTFLQHERVINAAGGLSALKQWLLEQKDCQWTLGDGYHHHHMDLLEHGLPVRLCWHHEHFLRDQQRPELLEIGRQNTADWALLRVASYFMFDEAHQLSLPELCWWAVLHHVSDLLPESVARVSLRLPPATFPTGPLKEADIVWERAATEVLTERIEFAKPVLNITVDPEPPAGFLLRPKMKRWECEKYTQWVKTQSCCCGCGQPADDPHHIIDHGFGGTGTKPHDIFTIPLTRQCHNKLHADVAAWEAEHGNQLYHLARTLDRAFGIGAIVTASKRGV